MEDKRRVSVLIPFKIRQGKILVYLQKRSKDAPRLPDYFGFFGGGIEGNETSEEALRREIKEELDFTPIKYDFLGNYEFSDVMYAYILEVDDDFEKGIKILEGEYGKFFSKENVLNEPKLIETDKLVLEHFYMFLEKTVENLV